MNAFFKTAGLIACTLAVLGMNGGHWLALQSVAWTRMIVEYSRHDSLGTAIAKTFDGRHPCALCLSVREGRQREQQQDDKPPWATPEKMPDLFCDAQRVSLPLAIVTLADAPTGALDFFYDFIESPPKPPPRALVAAL